MFVLQMYIHLSLFTLFMRKYICVYLTHTDSFNSIYGIFSSMKNICTECRLQHISQKQLNSYKSKFIKTKIGHPVCSA